MKKYETKVAALTHGLDFKIMAVMLLTTILWFTGAPAFLSYAKAYNLTSVSDTLTNSVPGALSGHTVNFTLSQALNDTAGADKIFVTFDPTGSLFTVNTLYATDFTTSTGIVVRQNFAACSGTAGEAYLGTTTANNLTLTICTGDSIASSTAISLHIATTSAIVNPSAVSSYVVRVQTFDRGTVPADLADTRVAIINNVKVTASVDTTFTFTISGLASGSVINGVTTSTTTTATLVGFGTLDPTAGASTTAGQRLNVTTNAVNGFNVTVREDQNLTSSNGADIDLFKDGFGTPPTVWAQPSNTLGTENTYGHFGITTSDDVSSSAFSGSKFSGQFATSTLSVFSHTGPSDGTTANIGQADIAYKVAITSLQEAATDYQNFLTYVATPTF